MRKYTLTTLIIILTTSFVWAQTSYDTLITCTDKTVITMFASKIVSVDIGSQDYAYQVDEVNGDMIKFKAKYTDVKPTSFMIRTQNQILTGLIKYNKNLDKLLYDYRQTEAKKEEKIQNELEKAKTAVQQEVEIYDYMPAIVKQHQIDEIREHYISEDDTRKRIWKILVDPKQHYFKYAHMKNDMVLSLSNIYVDEKYLYVKFVFDNPTSIPFKIDYMAFELEEKGKKTKNSAEQKKIFESKQWESLTEIPPRTVKSIVYAIDVYAFENRDKLSVKVNEFNGERTFTVEIPGKEINQAQTIR